MTGFVVGAQSFGKLVSVSPAAAHPCLIDEQKDKEGRNDSRNDEKDDQFHFEAGARERTPQGNPIEPRNRSAHPAEGLLKLELDLVSLKGRAFAEVELVKRLVVLGGCLDLRGPRVGQVFLQLQHDETGAPTRVELLLLGVERIFRKLAGGAGGFSGLVSAANQFYRGVDLLQDRILDPLQGENSRLLLDFGATIIGAVGLKGEWEGENDAATIVGVAVVSNVIERVEG